MSPLPDNSVCARCGAHSGDQAEHALVGKLPMCAVCSAQVTNWPYPTWLKTGLTALLILLVFALAHGRQYFHAGSLMYRGERLVEERRYAEALPYLKETLRIAPGSDKAALLTAKAALKTGDITTAGKALDGHNGGHFENGDSAEFREVKSLWDRAVQAMNQAQRAAELMAQEGHDAEAAGLMHRAAAAYPEAPGLLMAAEYYDAGAAFERKDYDAFFSLAQEQWRQRPSANTAALLSSAAACKYAITGDANFRQQSEALLSKALELGRGDAEAIKELQEFSERNRYRLDSRNIIGKNEYDRRFRNAGYRTR